MKNERQNNSKGNIFSMFFDMDNLKRRNSKHSTGKTPAVFVTLSPELEKKTKAASRNQRRIKIAILGKSGVGKSALVVRYLTKRFIGEYQRSVETHASTEVDIDGENVVVEILDTCASEDKLLEQIKWADGFILAFSITDYWSLYEVARLSSVISQIKNHKDSPVVVLSNQTDMEKQRRISRTEANQFLNDLGKPVYRTSASSDYESVRTAFDEAARLVYKWKFSDIRGRRSRSGSFMDPLREVLNRLNRSPSCDEMTHHKTNQPAGSADINDFTLALPEPLRKQKTRRSFSEQTTSNVYGGSNHLQIPRLDDELGKRGRSHSFT